MRRLKLGTILLLIHMGMLLAAMVVVGGAGVSLLRRLADDRAVAQTEAAAGGALSAIERGGDRLLSSVKLLAKRPTLNRLLRSGDDGELAVFLADFRNTSEFTDCAVRYGDRFVSTDGFPAFSGAGSDGGSDWRVLTPEEGPMILFARSPAEETPGASVMAVIVLDEEYARETGEKVALPVSILSRRDVENHGYGLLQSLRHRALGGNGNTSARLDEDRIYYAAVPLPDRTGGIAGIVEAAIPMESVAAPLKKLIRGLLVLTFVTGLLATVLSRVLARRIAGPIGTLTAAASRIGRGDLLSPVPRVSGPEIDVLANTMEEMRERVLALTNDLCKRRNESEAILTGIAEGVFEVDRERRIRYMNPQAAALLDIEPDFGIGRFCGDILRPRGQSGVRPCDESCPILHARFRGRAQATEYLRRPDGTYRAVVITSAPSGAHYDGDVRELHQFQVMREETEEESARRLRDAVLANISHEFRTPLTAQLASLELLRDKLPDLQTEEVRELVLSIERGTLRLSHLIDNLLESSRIERGDQLRFAFDAGSHPLRSDIEQGDFRKRSSSSQMMIDEYLDRFGTIEDVSMRQLRREAEVFGRLHEGVGLGMAVGRVGAVLSAVDEQHRHRRRTDILRRVPEPDPFCFVLGRHLLEVRQPNAVFVEKPATVDGHGRLEAVVQPGHDASQIAAPTDAGHRGPLGVDFGKRANEGMGTDHIRHGVIGPLVGDRQPDVAELAAVCLIRSSVGRAAAQVHRDGGISPSGPQLGPLLERFSAAAVDQHHRGQILIFAGVVRDRAGRGIVGKHPRRLALVVFAPVVQRANLGPLAPLKIRRAAQGFQVQGVVLGNESAGRIGCASTLIS